MVPTVCSDITITNSEDGTRERVWSEEHDRIPLKQRLKIMLASRRLSDLSDIKTEEENGSLSTPRIEIVVKKEDEHGDKQGLCMDPPPGFQAKGENVERLLMEKPREPGVRQEIEAKDGKFQTIIPKTKDSDDTLVQDKAKAKALLTDNLGHSLDNSVNTFSVEGLTAIKVKKEAPDDFLDDLDNIVLKERKRILLSRKPLGLTTDHVMEGLVNNGMTMGTPSTSPPCPESDSCGGKDFNSKAIPSSSLPTSANIKVEPLDYNELQNPSNFAGVVVPVKNEVAISDECTDHELDHMLLRDRIKLTASSREVLDLNDYKKFVFSSEKIVNSAPNCTPVEAQSDIPLRIKRTRKRKKTATDSVETALEEDAPGLLQVLINKGVLADEIKLYGEKERDEVLDDSLTEDSFSDLESVVSKLFSQSPSLLKLPQVRCTKGEKATYCLSCLISLVEQARYLLFRKWPVEWGWCRDLQSFIFVFERHNRIVLERPEYGYATYFFELVDTFPIDWQIKRLVTAMKLTSCSRVTLLENRALTVGEDMSEGEARVLMEYGWVPNSGFGDMLNYRDRVVHDRKNESSESSDWRSKIGKLLMDGYNGGRIVPSDIPEKVTDFIVNSRPQIKLEI